MLPLILFYALLKNRCPNAKAAVVVNTVNRAVFVKGDFGCVGFDVIVAAFGEKRNPIAVHGMARNTVQKICAAFVNYRIL
jgi:hypothetical protein